MTDSRKIDALIAKHVMGIPILANGKVNGYHLGLGEGEPKQYSTSISAAWEVVEKMRNDGGWSFLIEYNQICHDGVDFRAEFGCQDGVCEDAPAPMAICLAALEAKGIEV